MVKPTPFFDDLETFTAASNYYKLFDDTNTYLVGSIGLKLNYDKDTQHYKTGSIFLRKHFYTLDDYFNFYMSKKNIDSKKLGYHQIHYFHNGARFDFNFLIKWCKNQDSFYLVDNVKRVKFKEFEPGSSFFSLNWNQSYRTFSIVKKLNNKNLLTLEFRDSLYLFRNSVKELGQDLGEEFLKGNYQESTNLVEKTGYVNTQVVKYCLRDCEIVALTFLKYLPYLPKSTHLPLTVGSWSRQVYLSSLKGENKYFQFQKLVGVDDHEKDEINTYFTANDIYKGGLSTINRNIQLKIQKGIYVEDVVSQYPHKMTYRMPYGRMYYNEEVDEEGCDIVFQKIRYTDIKAKYEELPDYLYVERLGGQYSNEAKEYEIYESNEFIKIFETLHEFKKKDVIEKIGFHSTKSYFKEFVDDFIQKKDEAPKNSAERNFYKLVLNNLSGKLGQRELMEQSIFLEFTQDNDKIVEVLGEDKSDDLGLYRCEVFSRGKFTYLHIISWITSLSRAYLLERAYKIYKLGGVVYGHDTDSNFFHLPKKQLKKLKYGRQLGDWDMDEIKDFYSYGFALGVKKYIFWNSKNLDVPIENLDYKMGTAGVNKRLVEQKSIRHFLDNQPFDILIKKYVLSGIVLEQTQKTILRKDIYERIMFLKYGKTPSPK